MTNAFTRQIAAPLEDREFIEMVADASDWRGDTALHAFMWHRPDGQVDMDMVLIWGKKSNQVDESYQVDGGTHNNTFEAYVEVREYKRAATWTGPVKVTHLLGYRDPTTSQQAADNRNKKVHLEVEHNDYEA
jgi:hypothetical protein